MLERMSPDQFAGWRRYYRQQPFGELRADLRSGVVAAVVANTHRDSRRRPQPYRATDFMPFGAGTASSANTTSYDPVTDPRRWSRTASAVRAAFGRKRR